MTVSLTDLEALVARRIAAGEDPWGGPGPTFNGSRRVSQAIGRLRRKGCVVDVDVYQLTELGRAALEVKNREDGTK